MTAELRHLETTATTDRVTKTAATTDMAAADATAMTVVATGTAVGDTAAADATATIGAATGTAVVVDASVRLLRLVAYPTDTIADLRGTTTGTGALGGITTGRGARRKRSKMIDTRGAGDGTEVRMTGMVRP